MTATCLFCTLGATRVVLANELAVVIRNSYPVSPGHTLIIPKRHVGSFFDITGDERKAMPALLDSAKLGPDTAFHPDGYNIGINDGDVAGQTVPHLHLHLIPRYAGDSEDPRGGVRDPFASKLAPTIVPTRSPLTLSFSPSLGERRPARSAAGRSAAGGIHRH